MATQLDMLQQRLDEQESEVSDECELSDESDMDVEPGEMVAFSGRGMERTEQSEGGLGRGERRQGLGRGRGRRRGRGRGRERGR